jgi:hypothetical protein
VQSTNKTIFLIKNGYGNYVIQKAINLASLHSRIMITNNILKNLCQLEDKKLIVKWKHICDCNMQSMHQVQGAQAVHLNLQNIPQTILNTSQNTLNIPQNIPQIFLNIPSMPNLNNLPIMPTMPKMHGVNNINNFAAMPNMMKHYQQQNCMYYNQPTNNFTP